MSEGETATEIAAKIMDRIGRYNDASFAELAMTWPDHFEKGDLALTLFSENVVVWPGLSSVGFDAIDIVRPQTDMVPVSFLVYLYNGMALDLPLVKAKSKAALLNYKTPHWLPCVLKAKRAPAKAPPP